MPWGVGAVRWGFPSGGYVLGTPVLIYTYAGAEGYVVPTKIADSRSGTLLLSYQVPQVIGGNPDRYGLIEELQTDGTLVGTVDTYAEPIYYLTTDATGHYYSIDDHSHERIYRDGDGSDWSNISASSSHYNDVTQGIAINPDDGSVWFTANNGRLFSVDSSGSSLTEHVVVTPAGSHGIMGIVWVTDRFYLIDNSNGLWYSYQPGVGTLDFGGSSPDAINAPKDVTYSPLTGRLYFSTYSLAGSTFISSVVPGDSPVTELDDTAFGGANPTSVTCVGSALYVTCVEVHTLTTPLTATGTVWSIPIIPG